eukprot:comp24269_c0_seq1/m.45256 comp24269_c0_seq1/g.45256  ORF comp24269_c0_seq1/g.45256 comp24269_c0_seq1/m.45256 type:complete len:1770 (-) comp24269_c0_seq1:99-5408(-)
MALSKLQQLKLLLWKSWKTQIRRKVGTAVELLLPLLFVALVVGMKGLVKPESFPTQYQSTDYALNAVPWPKATKVVYYPPTGDSAKIMQQVAAMAKASNQTMQFLPVQTLDDLANAGQGSTSTIGVNFTLANGGSFGDNSTFWLRFPRNPYCTSYSNYSQCATNENYTWRTLRIYAGLFFEKGPKAVMNMFENERYFMAGFARMQYEIQKSIVNLKTTGNANTNAPIWNVLESYMQLFPYAEYIQNNYATFGVKFTMPLVIVLAYLYPVLALTRDIVMEKEMRLKEAMKMMGMKSSIYWLGWFLKSLIMHVPAIVISVIILKASGVIEYVNALVLLIFFLLYLICIISFSFMVSTWFSSAKTAAAVSGILFFAAYVPASVMARSYTQGTLKTGSLMGSCIFMNTCMYWGWNTIGSWEEIVTPMGFRQIRTPPNFDDPFTLGNVLIMFIFDTLLYSFIAFYVENVFPGEFGVSKPWYFLFTPTYWCPGRGKNTEEPVADAGSGAAGDKIEAEPPNLEAGVRIVNLSKKYDNGKLAVKSLSLNMYEDQITCLLGHNGAGKSTTMHILTGLYEPTGGTAYINGHDIRTDMEGCRESLGLCPQVNTLFNLLTVEEQLYFFGRLKGIDAHSISKEINLMLDDLEMPEKRHVFPNGLSGGMKRKLCVGIALIGGSKVVFLDEPTSGMDPAARRATWELIVKNKPGRTILLTTHFMDEADLLGNRIAIMAEGNLRALGSSLFLKKRFGVGYQMVLVKKDGCNENTVIDFVMAHIKDAKLLNNVGAELSFQLPDESSHLFEPMFRELETRQAALGIQSYGVSCTTLEEVFLKVGEEAEEAEASEGGNSPGGRAVTDKEKHSIPNNLKNEVAVNTDSTEFEMGLKGGSESGYQSEHEHLMGPGLRLTMQRFWALLVKRYISSKRDWKVAVMQLLLPVLFTVLAMVVARNSNPLGRTSEGQPPSYLVPSSYNKPEIPWVDNVLNPALVPTGDALASAFARMPYNKNIGNQTTDMLNFLLNDHRKRRQEFLVRNMGAFSLSEMAGSKINGTLWISTEGAHAVGTFINLYMQSVLQAATGNRNLTLDTVNFPFARDATVEAGSSILQDGTGFNVAFFCVFGYGFLYGSYIIFLVRERMSKAKHIQLVSGVSPVTYWLSNYFWDMVNSLVPIACIMIVLAAFSAEAYTNGGRMGLVFLLLLLFSWAYIPVMYIFSRFFAVPATGFSVAIIFNLITGMGTLIGVNVVRSLASLDKDLFDDAVIVTKAFYPFPNFAFGLGMMDIYKNWQLIESCKFVLNKVLTPALLNTLIASGVIPEAYRTNTNGLCTATDVTSPQLQRLTQFPDPTFHLQTNYVAWEPPGIAKCLLALFIEGIGFFAIVLLMEYNFFIPKKKAKDMQMEREGDDEDVAAERQRLLSGTNTTNDIVQIRDLTKVYPKKSRKQQPKLAVDHVTFGIRTSECFGLLGVNGAGKTTTFGMLTGDHPPTAGEVSIDGYNIVSNLEEVRQRIGYCPQFDALNEHLTGRETLEMYGRLRGVNPDRLSRVVQELIERMDLTQHCERECGTYSGGNKRKLSTAMALIGDPPVVFLDEPTTGVDPGTRRFLWDILATITKQGRCVVLTSHSMEECEALCTRLTIMVSGRLRCLGSIQHLKSRFGQGYTVSLKLPFGADTGNVKDFMATTFPGSELKEEHHGLLNYNLPQEGMLWSQIFGQLEKGKKTLGLEDYSVSQTTLEQIFIRFARQQEEDDAMARSIEDALEEGRVPEHHNPTSEARMSRGVSTTSRV